MEHHDVISNPRQTIVPTCRKRSTQDAPPAGLLRTSGHWNKRTNGPVSVNRLYADISTFTRQYARSYVTTTSSNQGTADEKMLSRPRARRAQSNRTRPPSSSVQRTPLRAERHSKQLSLERARLDNYVSRLPAWFSRTRRDQDGRYRSLQRRVANLVSWNQTHLDLTDTSAKENGLQYAFAALDRPVYASLRRNTRSVVIKHDPRCARLSWVLFAGDTESSPRQVWDRWKGLDISTRKAYAHKLLIYLLDRKPGRTLYFIQALVNDPRTWGRKQEAIADALSHLSKLHRHRLYQDRSWGTDLEARKREFVPAFLHVFVKTLSGQPDFCSQDLLYNLVELAKIEDLKKVFDCLVEQKARVDYDTVLHYATAFGQAGEVQYALKCLDALKSRHSAKAWESVVARQRLRWVCAVILRRSMTATKDFYHTPYIVAAFVNMGIQMDLLLYNVVIHNAMEAGDHATAFKVYNTFENNDLQPDKYTFGIMLHGCTMQDDPAFFQRFAQYCEEVAQDIQDSWLATEYLYYLYVRYRVDGSVEQTSAMLWQSYARLFTTTPLQPFVGYGTASLGNAVMSQDSSTPESVHLSPSHVALYIMLQTEIQSALAVSNMRVYNLYLKFKSVVQEGGHPAFNAMVRQPQIWNAFLYAFCQKQQFANASQLIQDMTDGPAKPNVYSWNIFMQAFFKTGQIQAAERIFEIMRDRGTDPAKYTWGVMVRGYANAQLVDQIDDILPHLDAEDESDPDLLRYLAKVVDRRKLMTVLERSRLQKEAIALERAEQEAEAERYWWQRALEAVEVAPANAVTSVQSGTTGSPAVEPPTSPTEERSGVTGSSVVESTVPPTKEQSGLHQDRASDPPTSTDPPWMPNNQPRAPRANLQDPEVQYRKLQERLGLVQPAAPMIEDDVELKPTKNSHAAPVFKSMIDLDNSKPRVTELGKAASMRKRARVNLARPKGRGDLR